MKSNYTRNGNAVDIDAFDKNISNGLISNPIAGKQNTRTTANRLYSGYTQNNLRRLSVLNYQDIIKSVNNCFKTAESYLQLAHDLYDILYKTMQISSVGIGFVNSKNEYINLKMLDENDSAYSAKVMLNDEHNPIARCFNENSPQYTSNTEFLKSSYLKDTKFSILPIGHGRTPLGVFIIGDSNPGMHEDFYQLIANYLCLYFECEKLMGMLKNNQDIDPLTGLRNHKSFQEELHRQIDLAKKENEKLSVCIFDVENITQINREQGHAKGDEIIKSVAEKINESMRNTDFAARYGGDEIAIIMPKTGVQEAKYLAEYICYVISCIYMDNVGPIKVSAGIADYPNITRDQEKLLILAEQAMCLSKSKTCETGQSSIVAADDYNFWDDEALKSFADILIKRHAQIGIDFEDELVKRFHNEEIVSNKHLLEVVTSLAGTIDAKDTYTKGHSTFVSKYAEALAKELNLPAGQVERIKLGAMLHDIGKIGIPESVLRKPDKLNDEEWEIMKQHPVIGAEKVLAPNESLHDLIPMVKYHHEHIDGSGYPCGLKGDEIPLEARIVAVADAYHALVSDRPYRKGMSCEKACEILKLGAGIQWDAELVRHFVVIAPSMTTVQ
ncbi:diguanylate cyclase [bacterium]|nr:diguanylate cyclase [bacterium]